MVTECETVLWKNYEQATLRVAAVAGLYVEAIDSGDGRQAELVLALLRERLAAEDAAREAWKRAAGIE